MGNDLVRYSRAGDAFHHYWAARRCLRMIYPKSLLRKIVIEGSGTKEQELAGEYAIDVSEYSDTEKDNVQKIEYIQLKHTTVQMEKPFKLSELKSTIVAFAKRYSEHFRIEKETTISSEIIFSIITNRPIDEPFKTNIIKIGQGDEVDPRFRMVLEKYTQLKQNDLQKFCLSVKFFDGEGDYNAQRYELHAEIAQLLAGTVDNSQIEYIKSLIHDKALPGSNGEIVREEVLKYFGVTSERDLYPAPPELEILDNVIPRIQHNELLNNILQASAPIIIHAIGGVGKSVFARQIAKSIPINSFTVLYDCFGGGRYRNRSELRHRHRDALVQIANELASHGLCDPLIALSTALDDQILREFLSRIRKSVYALKKTDQNARLVLIIDAADNAEMAAKEYQNDCFVTDLLKESLSEGCQLVLLCRTERIFLLDPSNKILQLELMPFSVGETSHHLKTFFPDATDKDGLEFHRLTNNGNPRVQANSLSLRFNSITELLTSLGPSGTSVQKQIEMQLNFAISNIKEKLSVDYQKNIETICVSLAILPPLIPINVIAAAANVSVAMIKSFVADLGRPLWISDESVQFRDEPTETWFRENFSATSEQIISFIIRLKPLAHTYSYVAESLPALFLKAEKYDDLISLALSEDFLPKNNPIDKRNIRVNRLSFAFKAALKQKKYADAIKLAFLAGEELAGNKRQREILTKNIDLIAPLQNEQRVQELAFRRMLHGEWEGSENVYSASLLSSVENFKGEARGYLRSAENWLHLYFEERKKKEESFHNEHLKDEDILELIFAYLNLFGIDDAISFILSWKPPEVAYRITKKFIKRLIDSGNFIAIDNISEFDFRNKSIEKQYLVIALTCELLKVGRFPNISLLERSFELLANKRTRIPKPKPLESYNTTIISSLVSFLEVCAVHKFPKDTILRILKHYVPEKANRSVSINHLKRDRNTYLRTLALRCVLLGTFEPNLDELIPKEFSNKPNYKHEPEIREFKEIIGILLPWHLARISILINENSDILKVVEEAKQKSKLILTHRYREADTLPYEISRIQIEILIFCFKVDQTHINNFFIEYLRDNRKVSIQDYLYATRSFFRLDHLSKIRKEIEETTREIIRSSTQESPDTRAEWYIDLARAVFVISRPDATAYFNYAIEAVSKFGDEIVERWGAIVSLARRTSERGESFPHLSYRFIRCAELVGDTVAREKYWDRDDAIRTCFRLSPESGLAALSRWRDREVGWFDRELPALADELIAGNFISPKVSWSLSAFFNNSELDGFACLCIEKESSKIIQQHILNAAIRDLEFRETKEENWQKLEKIAQKYSLKSDRLDEILSFYSKNPETINELSKQYTYLQNTEKPDTINWEDIFVDLELCSNEGISIALQRFKQTSFGSGNHSAFWQELYYRIKEGDVIKFLNELILAEHVHMYDMREAFSSIPEDWHRSISVIQHWGEILELVAQRFASEFTKYRTIKFFTTNIPINSEILLSIESGVLAGLSNSSELVDAETYFGFIQIASNHISPQEATDLVDFGLTRFELHIDNDFADGSWANWLKPPESIREAFTGFIWSALGSPKSETRWQAAHCVRRLAELNCELEIDSLIKWMKLDKVNAFGNYKFPFYNLHARQYLLIALSRVSIDNPQILKKNANIFFQHALEIMPHIIIQKFSSEIALAIEKAFPNTYESNIIKQLRQITVSQFPIKEIKTDHNKIESYWHSKEEIDESLKFYHGWDFDRYWFEPLGNVFGISEKQVEELATHVVVKEWNIKVDGSSKSDPRVSLWRSHSNERGTEHSHGTYPSVDDYTFYLSYHAMLVVASKLLAQMPVVHRRVYYENEWTEWLNRHLLTRKDGRWLADRRDPAPLRKPDWLNKPKNESWYSEIKPNEFLDKILFKRKDETWLNVFSSWTDSDHESEEEIRISTALVSSKTSQALLNALTTCSDHNDFKLPNYREKNMEFKSDPFKLIGWIGYPDTMKGLDEYDPFAGQIAFPHYYIGKLIVRKLHLHSDLEQREWFLPNNQRVAMCELWDTNSSRREYDPNKRGERLSASLSFLMNLSETLKLDIIIEIQIDRNFALNSYRRREDGTNHRKSHNKVYILSADGKLRDTETNYQLR